MSLKEAIQNKNDASQQGTQSGKAKTATKPNPLRFRPQVQYEFGELTKGSQPDAPDWRVKPTVRSGKHFIDLGQKTVIEYLENNPEGLRADRVITFYVIGHNGKRQFLFSQNPSAPKLESGMSDPNVPTLPSHMTIPGATGADEALEVPSQDVNLRAIAMMTRETLQVIKETNSDLMAQLSQVRAQEAETRSYYETMLAGLQRELIDTKQALEEWKAKAAEVEKEYNIRNEFQTQVNGLQDKLTEADSGMGLKDIIGAITPFVPLIMKAFERPAVPAYGAPAYGAPPMYDPYTGRPLGPNPYDAPPGYGPQPTSPIPQPIVSGMPGQAPQQQQGGAR